MAFWRASNPYLQEKVENEVDPTVVGPGAPTAAVASADAPTTVGGKKPPGHPKQKTHGEDKARAEARTGQPFITYMKLIKASQQSCDEKIWNFMANHGQI